MYKAKRTVLSMGIAISLAASATQAAETLTIQAESFENSGGTFNDNQENPVTIYSVNGQQAINYVNVGDYVDYTVNAIGGEYTIEYLVGTSVATNPGIEVLVNSNGTFESQGSVTVPLSSWDDFQPLTATHKVNLPAGTSTIRLLAIGPNWQWNLESFKLTGGTEPEVPETPVVGESFTVEMEAFTATGSDDARGGGMIIGERGLPQDRHTVVDSNQTGDWVEYEVNFPVEGNYSVSMLASGQTSHATAILFVDGIEINETPVSTGNQGVFEDFELSNDVYFSAGTHTIRVQGGSSTDTFSWLWFGDALTFTNLSDDSDPQPDVDSDNDGVIDSIDQCANTPTGSIVNAVGCVEDIVLPPSDADNDGVIDSIDQCPNTPAGSVVDAVGCVEDIVLPPSDADNDGVIDSIDQCPNTPLGTNVDSSGCATEAPEGAYYHSGNGLLWARVDGATNFIGNEGYVANPDNYDVTTDLAETDDAIKANSTEVFRGQITDADGHISFYENIDDSVRLYIDGVLVLSNDSWQNSSQTTDLNLTPGTHDFELRLGNADGGSGAVSGIGFGVDINGGTNFVHPSALSQNIFSSAGNVIVDPILPPPGGVVIELENFDSTGTVGRVASDPNDGFVADAGATNVSFVTNGDYGVYTGIQLEAGTYRSFINVATGSDGSYGARIDINGITASWAYFDSTGGWESPEEVELYGGEFVIETTGTYTLRVEAIGGSDWQWSGDNVRLAKVSDNTYRTPPVYNPNDHDVSEINGPTTGLQFLKKPLDIPTANKVLKSDVWYTYPQNRDFYEADGGSPGDYADFGATGSFWGHPPESEFYDDTVIMDWAVNVVGKYQSEGLEYTARGEFDWGYGWFTEYTTDPQKHYVQTLDDRNVRMTFMGYLSHNGHNNNWLSNHSPAFVPFMKSQVDQLLKANPDKLMFDTQTNSTRSTDMRTFGGDFSPYAMANFRTWLSKKYGVVQLSAMGIDDITTFDYKQHLLDAGITHTTFSNGADKIEGNIPMLEDFLYFNRDVWNQKFGDVLSYIRETHPNIAIGASTQLFESRGYLFNENITFLSGELNLGAKTSTSVLPTNIIVHLKGAQAIDKTLAYAPYPWEFEQLRVTDSPRFGRGWVAQAYAYGGLFSIPANVWVGGDVFTWSPGADNYRDIYQFVRANEALLDDYTSYAKAGVVHAMYSSMKAGFIDGGNQIQSSVKLLTEENINFDMLVFGDEGYQVVPRAEDFEKFDQIFYDGDLNYLTAAQQAVLDQYNAVHIGQRGNYPELAITVSVNGTEANSTVSAVSRIHETNDNAPYVVHLVNRPFAGGVTPTLNNVEVAIPQDYFPQGITSATIHLPDGTSNSLPVTTNASGAQVVTVNNLEVWGIIEFGH
ncbi:carbohydrate-binding protein [Colwellia sp. E2M01]|uniref:carbohydrate-binding protein n=1 Tax=Colwellia sp. E2M01 TaxID=2841561 RepID=UPI001C08400D|nr:carbohydrate-binding protein [Colwellia sp. E2M01]MBU2870662.1 carbohydrate-binding protein [Colwellia sp. E2M01]